MFFSDCLSFPRNFLAVFNLNSSFSFSYNTFLDNISLSSFKFWVFSNDDVVRFFTFISEFTISLRTIFYNLVLWLSSFFFDFKFTCFFVESSCIFYRTIRTFFDNFCFTFFKFWVVSVFSVITKFNFLNNWFHTNSYYPIFFFSDSLSSFCWVSYWLRILNLLSNCNFFLAWFTFIFNLLESSFKIFIIDYLSFIRNFSFYCLSSFSFSRFSTYFNNSFFRLCYSFKFAFFNFSNLAIFYNKSVCSFL